MKKIYAFPAAAAAAIMLSLTSVNAAPAADIPEVVNEPVYHTITFISGNGGTFTGGHTEIVESLSSDDQFRNISFPAVEAKAGYRFTGWSLDGGKPHPEKYYAYMIPTSNHVFTAVYEQYGFTLTLDAGEHGHLAEGDTARVVEAGKALGNLPVPSAEEGYLFTGWMINGSLYSVEQAAEYIMPESDLLITAQYSRNAVSVNLSAGEFGSFEDGAVSQVLENILPGTILKPSDLPTVYAHSGYVFKGWSANGTDLISEEGIAVEEDGLTLTALYEKTESPEESDKPGTDGGTDGDDDQAGSDSEDEDVKEETGEEEKADTESGSENKKPGSSSSVQTSAAFGVPAAGLFGTGSLITFTVLKRKNKR